MKEFRLNVRMLGSIHDNVQLVVHCGFMHFGWQPNGCEC